MALNNFFTLNITAVINNQRENGNRVYMEYFKPVELCLHFLTHVFVYTGLYVWVYIVRNVSWMLQVIPCDWYSFMGLPALIQVHSLFQTKFSTECDIELSFS
jgi:hypothetical protein